MKCPKCNGKGDYFNEVYNDGKRRREILIKCNKCHGSGEVQMTEQEWLQTADTEQLAEWIAHQTMIALLENQNNHSLRMTYPAYWVEWLKQPHT